MILPIATASASPSVRSQSRAAHRPRASRTRIGSLIGTLLFVGLSLGSVARAADPVVASPDDFASLLSRIQQAAQRENYSGTFVHQQNNQVQSSRITHIADRSGEHEKLELLDGQVREFIRNNEDVQCFVPDRKLILAEKRAKYDSFPALLTSQPVDVQQFYRYVDAGPDRVAGRPARAIWLEATDGKRYGYRLWFDRDTFLLLKAQTIGERNAVLEQVAFTDVAIGQPIDRSRIKPSVEKTDGWRTETGSMTPVDLTSAGWSVRQPIAGFRKIMEVRRAFGGREDIGQMVFSDGLAAISVFIEASPPQNAVEGDAEKGPMHVVTRRNGKHWLTVVGDAPKDSVAQMARSVEYVAPASK